jgi:leucyl aminopeptidase (aminopeptidase T)
MPSPSSITETTILTEEREQKLAELGKGGVKEKEDYLSKVEPRLLSYVAEKIVKDCLGIKAGENVTIETWTHGLSIAKELVFQVRKAGATPVLLLEDENTFWRTVTKLPPTRLGKVGANEWSILENTDVYIFIPGPEDMERFEGLPERVSDRFEKANEEWYERARRAKIRGVRVGLGYVTPNRAKKFSIDLNEWVQEEVSALDVDYNRIDKIGRKIGSLLNTGKKVTISHENGTNLEFGLSHIGGRKSVLDTGVMKEQFDAVSSYKYGVLTNLPSGSVLVAPNEDSAKGAIKFNLPTPSVKGLTRDVSLTFGAQGRLTEYDGGENFEENFKKKYEKERRQDKGKAALFSIGLNPKQKTGLGFDDSAEGVVLFGIGHYSYGDKNNTGFRFYGLLEGATVEIDGKVIARGGRVLV